MILSIIDMFHDTVARPLSDEFRPAPRRIRHKRLWGAMVRWGTLRPIGCASAVVGVVIGARAVEPIRLSTLGTLELLGIVVLVLGPIATMLALRFDRRCAAQSKPTPSPGPRNARTTTHEAHTRSVPLPTRAADSIAEPRTPEHAI